MANEKKMGPMSKAVAISPEWVRNERRKQNLLVLFVLLLFLLLAFAPRNERRLFLFPREALIQQTIAPPVQTRLRALIGSIAHVVDKLELIEDEPEPPIEPVYPERGFDDWLPTFAPLEIASDLPMPNVPRLRQQPMTPRAIFRVALQARPARPAQLVLSPVPEPASWMLMIAGIGWIGAGMRRRHRSARRSARTSPLSCAPPPGLR